MSDIDEMLDRAELRAQYDEDMYRQLLPYDGIAKKFGKWVDGYAKGLEELGRAETNAAINAPNVFKEKTDIDDTELQKPINDYNDFHYDAKGKAISNDKTDFDIAAEDWWNKAQHNINEETYRPVATIAALTGSPLGMTMLAPFILEDLGKSIDDEDYIGAAQNAAFFVAPMLSKMANPVAQLAGTAMGVGLAGSAVFDTGKTVLDSNFQKAANEDPLGTVSQIGANIVPLFAPLINTVRNGRIEQKMDKGKNIKEAEREVNAEDALAKAQQKLAEKRVAEQKTAEQNAKDYAKAYRKDAAEVLSELVPKEEVSKAGYVKDPLKYLGLSENEIIRSEVTKAAAEAGESYIWRELDARLNQNAQNHYVGAYGRQIDPLPSNIRGTVTVEQIFNTVRSKFTSVTAERADVPQNANGWFNHLTEGIRVREHQLLYTVSHEVGHFIDQQLQFGGFDRELINGAVSRWGNGTYGDVNDVATHPVWRREGIAEFVTTWMLNPTMAEQNYPQFYQSFIHIIRANPQMFKDMNDLSMQIRRWYTQSADARAQGIMHFADQLTGTRLQRLFQGVTNVITAKVDEGAASKASVRRFEERTGIRLRLDENPAELMHDMLNNQDARIQGFLGLSNATDEQVINNLSRAMNVQLEVATFGTLNDRAMELATMPHVREYLKQRGYNSVSDALTNYMLAKCEANIRRQRGDNYRLSLSDADRTNILNNAPPEFEGAFDIVRKINHNKLLILERGGLIDHDTLVSFETMYPDYVPRYKSFAEEGITRALNNGRNSQAVANIDSMLHGLSRNGSEKTVIDPWQSLQEQCATAIRMAEKNMVGQAMADLTQLQGSSVLIEATNRRASSKHHIVDIYRNGQREHYKINDPALYDLIFMDKQSANLQVNWWKTMLRMGANTLRFGATNNPAFWAWNAMRDAQAAVIQSNTNASYFGHDAVFHVKGNAIHPLDYIPIIEPLNVLLNGVFKQWIGSNGTIASTLFSPLEATSQSFANYRNRYRQMRADYELAGVTKSGIIYNSNKLLRDRRQKSALNRNVRSIDWHDSDSIMRGLGKISTRTLSGIFDTYCGVGEFIENAPRFTVFERSIRAGRSPIEAAYAARNATTDFSVHGADMAETNARAAFFNATLQGNRTFIQALTGENAGRTVRMCMSHLVLPTIAYWMWIHDNPIYRDMPLEMKNKNWYIPYGDKVWVIPKPELAGAMFASIPERILDYMFDKDPDALKAGGMNIVNTSVPNPTPTAILPLFEWLINYDLYRGMKIVPTSMEKLAPINQHNAYTSQLAIDIGSNMITPLTPKGVSPMQIDHALKGYTAALGQTMLGLYDLAYKTNEAPEKYITEYSRFTHEPNGSRSRTLEKFYQNVSEASQKADFTGNEEDIAISKEADKVSRSISDLYRGYNKNVRDDKDLSRKVKRDILNDVRKDSKEIAKEANKELFGFDYVP